MKRFSRIMRSLSRCQTRVYVISFLTREQWACDINPVRLDGWTSRPERGGCVPRWRLANTQCCFPRRWGRVPFIPVLPSDLRRAWGGYDPVANQNKPYELIDRETYQPYIPIGQ